MSLEGKTLGGRYDILGRLGGGGMASVYLAQDQLLKRRVAVKVMNASLGYNGEFVRRFNREAKAAASMSHPNVVNVYDAGKDGSTHYMIMEYMEGASLMDLIQERGSLSPEEAIAIAIQICNGLAHAHQHGIVHRDIKPHNIMSTADGQFKVGDFGISRPTDATAITRTGFVMGSVHYFSPEQAKGGDVGPQSDLYSLGVVLYYMVTGRLPFDGTEAIAIALKHLQETVPDPRRWNASLGEGLCRVIRRSMAKSVRDRYRTAEMMKEDLQRALEDDGVGEIPFVPPSDQELDKRGSRRRIALHNRIKSIGAMVKPGWDRLFASFFQKKRLRWGVGGLAAFLFLMVVIGGFLLNQDNGGTASDGQMVTGNHEGYAADDRENKDKKEKPSSEQKEEEKPEREKPAQPLKQKNSGGGNHDWRKEIPPSTDGNDTFSNFVHTGRGGDYTVNMDVKSPPGQVFYNLYVVDKYGSEKVLDREAIPHNGTEEEFTPVQFSVHSPRILREEGMVKITLFREDLESGRSDIISYVLEMNEG
ncbi:protein kinase domain-containing protein [Salinithrix halophila]|uniref:Protein kinase n=1 Tax=Salinithrix halophila TaxID=1485204 RepID=A0ABV8JDH4_9BACL